MVNERKLRVDTTKTRRNRMTTVVGVANPRDENPVEINPAEIVKRNVHP